MNDILYVALPFTISMVLTPIVKRIAFRLDAFAQINERTVHSGKIVRIGGAAIYLAFIVSMAVFMKTDMAMNGILLGGTIMFFGGLIDDFVNLRPLYKFTFQIVAAVVLIASGVTLDVIRLPLGITIPMGVISVIVTFFVDHGNYECCQSDRRSGWIVRRHQCDHPVCNCDACSDRTKKRCGNAFPDPCGSYAWFPDLQCTSGQHLYG